MPEKNSKIKVLHIITRLDAGGSSYNTLETCLRLNKDRYETILITGKTKDPHDNIKKFIRKNGINCIIVNSLVRMVHPLLDFVAFMRLWLLIKDLKPDIVHTHTSKAGILGRWAAYFNNVKHIVHTPHGHVFYGYFGRFLTSFFIVVERLTAKITDRIISLTHIGRKEHIHFRIAKPFKFVTIYSGIKLQQFKKNVKQRENIRKKFKIPAHAFIFGTVTRLDLIKGNKYLIEAFAYVLRVYPKAYLLIVGEGSEKKYLKEKAKKLHIEKNIIFAGFQKEVSAFINLFDIFVLASLNEGMGRVILEAMACQKPVISTRTGGIPELIEDGQQGILVPPKDVDNLAEAMLELIGDKTKIKKFGESGKQKVTEKFSVEKMIFDIERLYEKLLKQKVSKR